MSTTRQLQTYAKHRDEVYKLIQQELGQIYNTVKNIRIQHPDDDDLAFYDALESDLSADAAAVATPQSQTMRERSTHNTDVLPTRVQPKRTAKKTTSYKMSGRGRRGHPTKHAHATRRCHKPRAKRSNKPRHFSRTNFTR